MAGKRYGRRTGNRRRTTKWIKVLGLLVLIACLSAVAVRRYTQTPESVAIALSEVPEYQGDPYVEVHANQPGFSADELTTRSFESYQTLDALGRCGNAYACIGTDLMPTEKRGEIGSIHPSGWHTVKYDRSVIPDQYLYNRCHLIAYQLSGENANERNLITGTRYMNVQGMLPFEEQVGDYVRQTGNHVMYRVTPVFKGTELVARGVLMEAESVEDRGRGVSFCVYVYNVQPGIQIDYQTGESRLEEISSPY